MLVHVCELCGYEYRADLGDAENDIPEGTDFEDLPADWVCPLCGASREDFAVEVREDDDDLL